jgi:hypothetical protein
MALSNAERVGKALDLLNQGLRPFVERELQAAFGEKWQEQALESFPDDHPVVRKQEKVDWDTQALLVVMWNRWNDVFKKTLGHAERSLVSELRDVRNRWAHQEAFSTDDAYRAIDSMHRLLTAVSADQAVEIDRQKQDLLRARFDEQARRESKKAAVTAIEGQPAGGLKPWREIVTPHPDVASGRYQQAEFAADLGQVHRGEGSDEYKNPTEFYRRTYLTEGLKDLLGIALTRLSGKGGDPVVELQTNFGGGKTHSMLALYHLFAGVPASSLPGIEPVLDKVGVSNPPKAKIAVLVGTASSPAQPHTKSDGTKVHTLWGDLAWQLLGKEGYALVAEADKKGINPGSDALQKLFKKAAPCMVLIDEWVAYVRQLYVHPDDSNKSEKRSLPAGSFEANMTFAQSLCEATKNVPNALLVASLPSSDIEIGGEGGRQALNQLKNTFHRIAVAWRPASAEEGFEIVRRRLFQPIQEPHLFASRDAVVRAFSELYRSQHQEFPSVCREAEYERRIKAAYPIHPELFDRLYNEWSSLDRFQRTRGVLRLMAAVIHSLWERQDSSLLIMPANVPVDDPYVQKELTSYLEDNWIPIIERDVDGANSLPLQLDRENPNLGRYSATRRVARSVYLGSAPTLHTAHKGLEDQHVRLGCVQPGESVATFSDALRRLTDRATHLYVDGKRYWYSTQPSVVRLAQDRAEQMDRDLVLEEIKRRVREEQRSRGDFAKVHPCPESTGDIPDEPEARLIILGPEHPHAAKGEDSAARKLVASALDQRGTSPRHYRNAVVFLAPDRTRLEELEQGVRQYLAWKSIETERETLNLDAFQSNQAKTKREQADDTVAQRIPETYQWVLVPCQPNPTGALEWREIRVQGQDALAVRASKKLKNEELLITQFAGTRLRMELDRIPLWRGNHVPLKQLAEDFPQYLYLPRLKDVDVLLEAVRDGLNLTTWEHDTFAYADGWDDTKKRYRALRGGRVGNVTTEGDSLLVKPDVGAKQIADDQAQLTTTTYPPPTQTGPNQVKNGTGVEPVKPVETKPAQPKRFFGTVNLDATRVGRDAGKIAEEVVQHLTGILGSKVEITLEIRAEIPSGVPDNVVRTVTENCRTLKFPSHGFEKE